MNTITLAITPQVETEFGNDLPTRFSGVAYSGGVIPKFGKFGDAAIDLSNLQVSDRLFALINHDPNQRAGHGKVWIDNNQLHIDGHFSKSTESGRQLAAEFRDGAPWQLSVGLQYDAHHPVEPVNLNGQTMAVTTVFTKASIREVSFVPIGADPNTSVTAFSYNDSDSTDTSLEEHMNTELDNKIAELQSKLSTVTEQLQEAQSARQAAESSLASLLTAAKSKQVEALFADLGKEFTDQSAKPWLELSADTLTSLINEVKAIVKPVLDPALTKPVATAGVDGPDLATLSAKLFNQVAGKESL